MRGCCMPVSNPFTLYLLLLTLATSMTALAQAAEASGKPPLAAPASPRPAPPGSVESIPLSPTSLRVYWSAPPEPVAGFRVMRDGQPVAELGPEARSFDNTGLEPGHNHRYRVVAAPQPPGASSQAP